MLKLARSKGYNSFKRRSFFDHVKLHRQGRWLSSSCIWGDKNGLAVYESLVEKSRVMRINCRVHISRWENKLEGTSKRKEEKKDESTLDANVYHGPGELPRGVSRDSFPKPVPIRVCGRPDSSVASSAASHDAFAVGKASRDAGNGSCREGV